MSPRRAALPLLALLLLAAPACAAPSDLGRIDFPNSGAPAAQEAFLRGVLLLHSFEFEDSGEAFREAQTIDPSFALAYWGEAMSLNHPLWAQQDRAGALDVLARLAPTAEARLAKAPTEREKDFLRAVDVLYGEGPKAERDVAYMKFMDRMRERYPDDLEVAAFDALAILGSVPERDFRTYMRAASVAEEVFAKNPLHPGAAHYLIHSYDDPIHAPLGLRPARVYAQIAPAASHAQHMISHIYAALGWWDPVVSANVTAVSVSEKRLERKGQPLSRRSHHALYWLEYGLLQEGRVDEARAKLATMRGDVMAAPNGGNLWHYAHMRTTFLVNAPGAALDLAPVDDPEASLPTTAADLFGRGLAALRGGDVASARTAAGELSDLVAAATPATDDSLYSQETSYRPSEVEVARILDLELQAMILFRNGDSEEALTLMAQATEAEDARPLEYGPPDIVKPTHELRGEMLLSLGRFGEARAELEKALDLAPRRACSLAGLARAARELGDEEAAGEAEALLGSTWKGAEPPGFEPALRPRT